MKRRLLSCVLAAVLILLLAGCGCDHVWLAATCTAPRTCELCGEHQYRTISRIVDKEDEVNPGTGAPVSACDLRAGAALIIAGLAADGYTEIDSIQHIERGYDGIVQKLSAIGADIRVVVTPDEEKQSQVG